MKPFTLWTEPVIVYVNPMYGFMIVRYCRRYDRRPEIGWWKLPHTTNKYYVVGQNAGSARIYTIT